MDEFEDKIREIIQKEIKYLATYTAKVIDNDIGDGKLKISCEELGWEDESSYATAYSRNPAGTRIIPEIGDYVELSFHAGKVEYPVWKSLLSEINQGQPEQYSGPTDRIIFEDRGTGEYVKYNSETGILEMSLSTVNINGDSKGIARLDDTTTSDSSIDSIFWAWIAAAGPVLAGLGVVAPVPTSLASKINSASSSVNTG